MKKLLLFTFLFLYQFLFSQSVMRMNDPSIVAQEKRMVFQQWGDWRPKPKYFLGVQTNFAYGQVWGMWAPKRNRDYKGGSDIRPLKPTGLQNQRYAQISLMENEADKLMDEALSWHTEEENEFLNKTNVMYISDPLYLVYYKPKLDKLAEFPINSIFYRDWGFTKQKPFQDAIRFGMIDHYRNKIEEMQDKYKIAKGVNVSRGKRLLMYHELFLEWRNMKNRLKDLENTFRLEELAKSELLKWKEATKPTHTRSDDELFREALNQANIY